ncbi:MAG: DUF4860 domain-containing protein [Lachnospiraceae bacterium]|nr:DUF4860 domain-containing protein [Lachnospiraceae bacterium]
MRRHSTQNVLIFIIFSIFAILSLVLIAVGIQFYNSISDKVENNSEIRASVSYLENKLRSNDYEGGVEVVKIDGKDVILLSNEGSVSMKTAIYVDDGKLQEYIAKDNDIKLGYGDTITSLDNMSVVKDGNVINITLDYDGAQYNISKTMNSGVL